MTRKKGKAITFDAMVKFFIKNYDIPTKRDMNALITRIDKMEEMIITALSETSGMTNKKGGTSKTLKGKTNADTSASDTVLGIIKKFGKNVTFADISSKTGFEEKKLRNIIFRLSKIGKIDRIDRGKYTASQ